MDEYVIEKYIEISVGISTYADPAPHSLNVSIQKSMIGSTFIHLYLRTLPRKINLSV